MSVTALNTRIAAAREDGRISLEEAEAIISPNDPTFKSPKGIGTFFATDELEIVKTLSSDIEKGAIIGEPGAKAALDEKIAQGADSRAKHILKGGPEGSQWRKAGALAAMVPVSASAAAPLGFLAMIGTAVALEGAALAPALLALAAGGVGVAVILAVLGIGALAGMAAGHVGGMIHGAADD